MRSLFILLSLITIAGYTFGQGEKGTSRRTTTGSDLQGELIRSTAMMFPDSTQFALALISPESIDFIGVKKIKDTVVAIENRQSVFEIGSISKVFTAILLAYFAEEGLLSLDDTIQNYLDIEWNTDEPITFRQLANHTSGLPRLPSNLNLALVDPKNPYKNYDETKLLAYLTEDLKLSASPGAHFEYSNLGAGLLGFLLGNISNSSYEEMLREIILTRYGMSHTSTDLSALHKDLVEGRDGMGNVTPHWEFNVLPGAGGILSTTEDMARFARAFLDAPPPELLATTHPTHQINENMKIGLGWHIITLSNGQEALWHNGATGGYTASLALDPDQQKGVVILTNVSGFHQKRSEIDNLCFSLLQSVGEGE